RFFQIEQQQFQPCAVQLCCGETRRAHATPPGRIWRRTVFFRSRTHESYGLRCPTRNPISIPIAAATPRDVQGFSWTDLSVAAHACLVSSSRARDFCWSREAVVGSAIFSVVMLFIKVLSMPHLANDMPAFRAGPDGKELVEF